ncbi:MAG TPA: toll/interleukin-1 receptor domain-containing protein [Ktedonobacteraceae bacterium]|nr:toll/interleukin-1 receptor domain-containing protein [Ktedonobacteraceae bacterium]
MPKVFISYRRDDSVSESSRIYEHLRRRFGKEAIFKDVDAIPIGVDFGEHIKARLRESVVMLVVMGKEWLTVQTDTGIRRLDDPDDWVRREIEIAFHLGLKVIPVLVNGMKMPPENQLPPSIRQLHSQNGVSLSQDPHFARDLELVIIACENELVSRRISTRIPLYMQLRSLFARILHWRGQFNTTQGRWVALIIVTIVLIVALLGALVVHMEIGSTPLTASPVGPVFPLHVASPGAECDHGWSSSYWSNRFGTINCLTTYTRITTQDVSCSDPGCTSVGTLEFALAAANLKLPQRYTISVVATLMVEGQKPVAGTMIGLLLQDFLPATPYGPEYAIMLNADGSYYVERYDCQQPKTVCTPADLLGEGLVDPTKSHTFGYRYDGKTTFAELDGVEIAMKSAIPPASFKFLQLLVTSSDTHTTVRANFGDFSILPE